MDITPKTWQVTALGVHGTPFEYTITTAEDTPEGRIADEAYELHGQLYRDREVNEYLGPHYVVRKIRP